MPTIEFPSYDSVIGHTTAPDESGSSVELHLFLGIKKLKEGEAFPIPASADKGYFIPVGGFPPKSSVTAAASIKRAARGTPGAPHKRFKGPPKKSPKRRQNPNSRNPRSAPASRNNGPRGQGRAKGSRGPGNQGQAPANPRAQQGVPHWAQGGQPNFNNGRAPPQRPRPQQRPAAPPGQFRSGAPPRQQSKRPLPF